MTLGDIGAGFSATDRDQAAVFVLFHFMKPAVPCWNIGRQWRPTGPGGKPRAGQATLRCFGRDALGLMTAFM
jgi:hypothetical protein